MALKNHSIARVDLKDSPADFVGSQTPLRRHTVFLVDFGGPDTHSPPCGQEANQRARRSLLNDIEEDERRRVRKELKAARRQETGQRNGTSALDEQ